MEKRTQGTARTARTEEPKRDLRVTALRRFAIAITLLNVLGHSWFGFEQSWATPLTALATTYTLELLFEWLGSRIEGRRPRFLGGPVALVNFLLSAHITGLAVAMLLYSNERLLPICFAAAVAICSKVIFRVPSGERSRHFLNPSNFGITMTLLCFPWVGIAPPYMFTENLFGWADWLLPVVIIGSGSFLNLKLTRKIPLILSWLGCFALQALLRHLVFDSSLAAALNPMTGVAFLLFTFYMVTDPATTPTEVRGQVLFGAAVAAGYGLLMVFHVVFGLFFSLTAVCVARGAWLYVTELLAQRLSQQQAALAPAAVGGTVP